MSGPRRELFMPDLVRGEPRETLNAQFLKQAREFQLTFRCPDCSFRAADGTCTVGWPNRALLADPIEIIAADGSPLFCKAFEPDDG